MRCGITTMLHFLLFMWLCMDVRVEVSGKQFVFPRTCACCGTFATRSIEIRGSEKNQLARTSGWAWDVPYCEICHGHVTRIERLHVGALAAAAMVIAVGFVAGFVNGPSAGLSVASLGLITVCLGFVSVTKVMRQGIHRNCWGLGRAVEYLGSNRDCHAFDIKSYYYARDFVLANHRKIVNASTKVAGILRNTEFGDYQVPRRLLRRRK
jgi:hypothetical protein